ncbi:DUF5686 domain-containing protein [Flavobacterium antarcticum]|uniref:DUF5686 family protein n=1 Tax=Flavobacterium antarcticum TaxID=271155 RepID=UPI0003B75C69|nr:DUF5686 family protein [Flavobacterium antarcticum]
MKHLIYLVLLITCSVQAQFEITGRIIDGTTKKPLPFASISTSNSFIVGDVDGNFILNNIRVSDSITVSYVGFESQKILARKQKNLLIQLNPISENLSEVIVGKNPAIGIIEKVIEHKNNNDPERKLRFFQFKVYNKLVITANPDSINGTLDSIFVTNRRVRKFVKLDSTNFTFKKIVSKRHIYQTEKISKVQFDGTHIKETVEATKMAGFKKPIYELIGLNLQSFSIYGNQYDLLENRYNGPLGTNALQDYSFKILDTLSIQNRKTYLIFFSDKKKDKKNGLNGILYIDAENYGVAKAVVRIKNIIDVSATHDYIYFPEQDLWFPSTRTLKIIKGNNKENIKILGGQIHFEEDSFENFQNASEKAPSDLIQLISKSVYYEHEFNQPLVISRKTLAIQIKDDAIKKSDLFWQQNRKDTLDFRGIETYKSLDSLVISRGLERKLNIGRRILDGYVPVSILDIDLRYLIKYNNYEGFRFGFGGVTNEKLSDIFKLDGYIAYGLKDDELKYKYGGAIRLGKASTTWFGGSYTDDLREIASTSFAIDKRIFKIYDPRPINVSTFYNYKQIRGFVETKIIPKTESIWELSQAKVEPTFDYTFKYKDKLHDRFTLTTFMVSLQWNPFSAFMLTPSGRLEIEKNYPKFTFQVTKSLPGFVGNDFEYTKFDLRIDIQKKYINGQKTTFYSEIGIGIGDIPLTHLYNMSPNNLNNDKILQRLTIAGKNSFETMYFNEFFSSRYAFFQVKHAFQRVTLFKKVKPSLVLVTRMGWGTMQKPEQHLGINYKTLDDGYLESGIELNKIFKGFGLSGFYRFGPNQLQNFEDNIAIKATFILDLGF